MHLQTCYGLKSGHAQYLKNLIFKNVNAQISKTLFLDQIFSKMFEAKVLSISKYFNCLDIINHNTKPGLKT